MGTFGKVALVFSLLFYIGMRRNMQMYKEQEGMGMYPTRTNFHEELSECRPDGGRYTGIPVNQLNIYRN